MRNLLIVVDNKRDSETEWHLYETKVVRVEPGADAMAVRELCTRMAVEGHLAYDARLRVRSWSDMTMREALTADLDAIEPSAEYIYPPHLRLEHEPESEPSP